MSDALITRNDGALTVAFTERAVALKSLALEQAALIARVSNAEEQQRAVEAQKALAGHLSLIEKARTTCKAPVLAFGKAIDSAAKEHVKEVVEEDARVAGLIAEFQRIEQAKERDAQTAKNETLTSLEKQRFESLSQANTDAEREEINDRYGRMIQAEQETPIPTAARVEGQRISNDFDVTVYDIHLLYRHHPNCVELTPRLSEIKNLLKGGTTPKGVTAKPIVKAGVTTRRQGAIEV